jgi:pSer/pThr/pTyr-binding forkhead associated (FHA) protein
VDSSHTRPVVLLRAETDAARIALGERDSLRITRFPFKVGRESRESRESGLTKLKHAVDRRIGHAEHLNDLYIVDRSEHGRNVSREHFRIDWVDGRFVLVDRGSTCGTLVAEVKLGGDTLAKEVELHDGDLIVVGSASSPYVFRFQVERQ